jgi:hypothetical protein
MTCRVCEAIVKRDKRQRLAHLALQIEAACELHGITGAQAVAQQESSRRCRNVRRELDNDERGEIVGEGRERAVPFRDGKRSFSRPTHQGGGDLDFGQSARCARVRLE